MNLIEPSILSNEELTQLHEKYMESYDETSFWRDLDDEMNHRCEEGIMDWPY